MPPSLLEAATRLENTSQSGALRPRSELPVIGAFATSQETLSRITGMIELGTVAVEGLIGLRFSLKLMAANSDNAVARLVYFMTTPFRAIFMSLTDTPSFEGRVIEFYDLIAILVHLALSSHSRSVDPVCPAAVVECARRKPRRSGAFISDSFPHRVLSGVRLSYMQKQAGMHRPAVVLSLVALVATACGTPAASALQVAPSPTSYWAFLWPLQTTLHTGTPASAPDGSPSPLAPPADTATLAPTDTPFPTGTSTATATDTPLPTSTDAPLPTATVAVKGLGATVTAGLLSCRYGPGANYLYLYALREGANIRLIGRTDGDNWHWAWVEGRNPCWVNTSFLNVEGDWRQLPIVYPGVARLPVSPYYPPTGIISVVRLGNSVIVEWAPIPLRAGDEEDEFMQRYILELWHCHGGSLIFEPLATNDTYLTVVDEPGCAAPSHARLFVQEKHGFSGPTQVVWPPWQ